MRLPRFRLRTLMIAVAVVAVILGVEPVLFRYAADEARSGDEDYIWGEAVIVWVFLNLMLAVPVVMLALPTVMMMGAWWREIRLEHREQSEANQNR